MVVMKKDMVVLIAQAKMSIDGELEEAKKDTIVLIVVIGFKLIELKPKLLIIANY